MATIHGVVLIFVCFQAASALRIGNYPHSRVNQTILPLETQFNVFLRIFSRYDLVAVPNIDDPNDLYTVAEMLKEHCRSYEFYLSARLLKPTLPSNDYYGVFYKSDVVSVSEFVRDQPSGAVAMRVHMNSTGQEFVMSMVHLSGTDVLTELQSLPAAFDRLQDFFNLENILFIGDFNTFYHFLPEAVHDNLTISTDPRYRWFIDWGENTFIQIVSFLQGSASRFLTRGDIGNWVEPDSVRVLDILEYFNLTLPEAGGMSAFLPVELELREPILRT